MQHKKKNPTMQIHLYDQLCIDLLNKYGCLSSFVVMRNLKVTHEHAMRILKQICEDYVNVFQRSRTQIYICGREPKS